MQVTLYKTNDVPNKLNKTITDAITISCVLKDAQDIDSPTITLNYNADYLNYNYAYIPDFNQYYFIGSPDVELGREINIPLTVDPLMTLKNEILSSVGYITRSPMGNKFLPDPMCKNLEQTEYKTTNIGSIAGNNGGNGYYILIKGGKV